MKTKRVIGFSGKSHSLSWTHAWTTFPTDYVTEHGTIYLRDIFRVFVIDTFVYLGVSNLSYRNF